jgi:hypothetical protein
VDIGSIILFVDEIKEHTVMVLVWDIHVQKNVPYEYHWRKSKKMVMIFQSEKALNFLLEEGEVYTFRARKRKSRRKNDWITNKRGGHKISNVTVEFVTRINRLQALSTYVSRSGFSSLKDWLYEIKRLHPKDVAAQVGIISGYLYHVTLKETKIT